MKSSGFIEEVMHTYTDYLFRIAYYYVKDSHMAEDIVQDVFMKLYCSNYVEQGELKAYLSRITANASKDYLKSWAYRKIKLTEKLFSKENVLHRDHLVHQEELNTIDKAILALPLKQREVIVYYYLESLSTKEISELVERPESTVKSRLKSGRDLLKQNLAKEEWEVLLHD
ncbi:MULTISPECIES: RNA polymerase sigma factor [unclassified Solibacillus]|uniref:RNA polymerase sigma factor n=1 Tax=unclassified Solibacillus TaxID=2637870 RepID=UPI0030D31FC0